ncbi:hypothetical protein BJ742DRAFT_28836 [Cladochytrium replicatum]|nr:hypothetical protein BJ742DRAFT_28836 [Cladochytrium replicatum]
MKRTFVVIFIAGNVSFSVVFATTAKTFVSASSRIVADVSSATTRSTPSAASPAPALLEYFPSQARSRSASSAATRAASSAATLSASAATLAASSAATLSASAATRAASSAVARLPQRHAQLPRWLPVQQRLVPLPPLSISQLPQPAPTLLLIFQPRQRHGQLLVPRLQKLNVQLFAVVLIPLQHGPPSS